MADHETTPTSFREKLAENGIPFSAVIVGRKVAIYSRPEKSTRFDPKRPKTEYEKPPDDVRPWLVPMVKVHEGKVTEKSDTYFSVGGVTVLKKDMENGKIAVRRVDKGVLERS